MHHDLNLGLHVPKKLGVFRSTHEKHSDKFIKKIITQEVKTALESETFYTIFGPAKVPPQTQHPSKVSLLVYVY